MTTEREEFVAKVDEALRELATVSISEPKSDSTNFGKLLVEMLGCAVDLRPHLDLAISVHKCNGTLSETSWQSLCGTVDQLIALRRAVNFLRDETREHD